MDFNRASNISLHFAKQYKLLKVCLIITIKSPFSNADPAGSNPP